MAASDKQEAGRRRSLYRLAVARSDIRAAQEIAVYADKHVPEINELWVPLQDALVAAYARPFTSNKPYGPLASQWTKFSDARHQQLHNQLVQLRNELVAHTDASQRTVVIFPPHTKWPVPGGEPKARATLAVAYKRPSPDYFASVRELCDDLFRRLHAGVEDELQRLFGDTDRTRPFDLLTGADRPVPEGQIIISAPAALRFREAGGASSKAGARDAPYPASFFLAGPNPAAVGRQRADKIPVEVRKPAGASRFRR